VKKIFTGNIRGLPRRWLGCRYLKDSSLTDRFRFLWRQPFGCVSDPARKRIKPVKPTGSTD